MTSYGEDDRLEDKSLRDFARFALGAGGALLAGPGVLAATPTVIDPAAASYSKYIYFYYLTPPWFGHHPRVRAYFVEDSVPVVNIAARVAELAAEAKRGKLTPLGLRMGALLWC